MRHAMLGAAATVAAGLICATALPGQSEAGSRLPSDPASPVIVINMHGYRWKVPDFRMAGRKAYAVIHVINPHDYVLVLKMTCKTGDKTIRQLSGRHPIGMRQTLQMDTRRFHHRMQQDGGVTVKCVLEADGSADVQAWIYDSQDQHKIGRGAGALDTTS